MKTTGCLFLKNYFWKKLPLTLLTAVGYYCCVVLLKQGPVQIEKCSVIKFWKYTSIQCCYVHISYEIRQRLLNDRFWNWLVPLHFWTTDFLTVFLLVHLFNEIAPNLHLLVLPWDLAFSVFSFYGQSLTFVSSSSHLRKLAPYVSA